MRRTICRDVDECTVIRGCPQQRLAGVIVHAHHPRGNTHFGIHDVLELAELVQVRWLVATLQDHHSSAADGRIVETLHDSLFLPAMEAHSLLKLAVKRAVRRHILSRRHATHARKIPSNYK
jgi:hypothetical protein